MDFDVQAASKRTVESLASGNLSAFACRRRKYMRDLNAAQTVEAVRTLRARWDACEHSNEVIIASTDSIGRVFAKSICASCATDRSGSLKRDLWFASDQTLYLTDRLRQLRASCWQANWDRINELKDDARLNELMSWRDQYDDYLRSDTWRKLRAKVLERDGLTCQGCLTAKATEVHHTTYQHYNAGRDMAFALVSLCASCHDAIHNH